MTIDSSSVSLVIELSMFKFGFENIRIGLDDEPIHVLFARSL